jgi:hypothetical protein
MNVLPSELSNLQAPAHRDRRREFNMILPFIAFAVLAILGLSCVVAPFVGSQQ